MTKKGPFFFSFFAAGSLSLAAKYAKQHAGPVIFCKQLECRACDAIRMAREEDSDCWPRIMTNSLQRALSNTDIGGLY